MSRSWLAETNPQSSQLLVPESVDTIILFEKNSLIFYSDLFDNS